VVHIKSALLNLFAERSQIQTYDFVREPHYRNFNTSQLTRFASFQNEVCSTKY